MPQEYELEFDDVNKVTSDRLDDISSNISESVGYETFNILKGNYPSTVVEIEDNTERH